MTDHMHKVHPVWRQVLNWVAKTDEFIGFNRLNATLLGPFSEQASDLASKFEQTLVDYLPDLLYKRRDQLCGGTGEKHNGFI